jgi:bacillithiol biosynthesis cysteine-adding enzyme BshC
MQCNSTLLSYRQTGYFNQIVTDYVDGADELRPFYDHSVNRQGFLSAIRNREQYPTDRNLLVKVLKEQYSAIGLEDGPVALNIEKLSLPNCFSICTAHQPNIFTGYLYFIYKIVHAIKLAEELKQQLPANEFVPVYYMGSEDADLEELGKVFLNGDKIVWDTKQTGAVGRMDTKGLDKIIDRLDGELSVFPHGNELISLLRDCYLSSPDIQTATLKLLHHLFESFGLVVLIADHPELKRQLVKIMEDDLFQHIPSKIVADTASRLSKHYKVQANPREINLFYLKDNIRNRIDKVGNEFVVIDANIRFSEEALKKEIKEYPERFSPNVILRGLYQESILPGIAFIGGGGELAYWLELKDLFHHYGVPYPVQILRNSFLLLEQKWIEKIQALNFNVEDFFKTEQVLIDELVKRDSAVQIHLTNEIRDAKAFYEHLRTISGKVDKSLVTHVTALETRMIMQLQALEKKLLRAEKRAFSDQSRKIHQIKAALFPNNNLQERVDNFMPYYAKYGREFLQFIYNCSVTTEHKFILSELPGMAETSAATKLQASGLK